MGDEGVQEAGTVLHLPEPGTDDHGELLDDRKVLCGILFVLYTGIRWEFLPQELRCQPTARPR